MWCSTGWAGRRNGKTIDSLASTGHWISYGHATGALPPLDPGLQSAKSLRVSRPVLFHYTDDPVRLRAMAANVFAMLERGVLRVTLRHRFPLSAAAAAVEALESRQTTGSIVLFGLEQVPLSGAEGSRPAQAHQPLGAARSNEHERAGSLRLRSGQGPAVQ